MIELQHLTKRFATQGGTVVALNDINLTIRDGDVYGIIGMSGAGKSTLVRCINMLERPDEGNVIVNGKQMQDLRAADLRAARREITMIFQQFNLLMQRTCLRNIMFPMELAKVPKDKAEARARELLELVGLPDKADAYPAQLSGGQKQRIAIARALATDPKVLLCDEATSALDPNTTHAILQLIQMCHTDRQFITHRVQIKQGGNTLTLFFFIHGFSQPRCLCQQYVLQLLILLQPAHESFFSASLCQPTVKYLFDTRI